MEADHTHARAGGDGSGELPHKSLGGYRIIREIGKGAMGTVYEAVQEPLNRRVALKVLSSSFGLEPKTVTRFLREAEALANIRHPNIVPIYQVGCDQGFYFYAMELVRGRDIQALRRIREFSFLECARIIRAAAEALDCAHRSGVIHRDVKPANLILDETDEVRVTDFGLAKLEKGGTITESGALVGTPMYMSPEQARGSKRGVDQRSDVYSLGATLYELVCRRPLFDSDSFQAILRKIVEEDPVPPRKIDSRVPRDLETITLKALHKEPVRRYQSTKELADDLGRFTDGEPILARRVSLAERGIRKVQRHKKMLVVTVPLLLLLGFTVIQLYRGRRGEHYTRLLKDGEVEYYVKNLDGAEENFRECIRLRPGDFRGHLGLARVLRVREQAEGALIELDRSVDLAPDEVAPYLERGRFHFDQGDFDRALEDFTEVVSLDDRRDDALCHIAKILYWKEDLDEALLQAVRAKTINPRNPMAHQVEGWVYIQRESIEEAQECLKKASLLDPDDEETYRALQKVAEVMKRTTDRKANVAELKEWLRWFNPLDAGTLSLGEDLGSGMEEQLTAIQTTVRQARRTTSSLLSSLVNRRSETNDPPTSSSDALLRLLDRGSVYEQQGLPGLALAEYLKATNIFKDRGEPFHRLSLLYMGDTEIRDPARARSYANQALARDPYHPDYLDALVRAYQSDGKLEECREFLREFFQTVEDHPSRSQYEKLLEPPAPDVEKKQ